MNVMNPAPPLAISCEIGRISAAIYEPGGLPEAPLASMLPTTVTSQDGKNPANAPEAGFSGVSDSAKPVIGWPIVLFAGWLIGGVACAGSAESNTGADCAGSNSCAQVRACAGIWITELSGTMTVTLLTI